MSDPEYLFYDHEGLDDGRLITVTYGGLWARFLVSAASILCNPEIWHPDCDVDEAIQRANELIARLIGEGVSGVLSLASDPLYIPALGLQTYDGRSTTRQANYAGLYFPQRIYSSVDVEYVDQWWFRVFLPAGIYVIEIFGSRASNRGRYVLSSDVAVGLSGSTVDLYSAVVDLTYSRLDYFSVDEDSTVVFTISKAGKNASSSSGHINVNGIMIYQDPAA